MGVKKEAFQESLIDKCCKVSFSSGSGLRMLNFKLSAVMIFSRFLANAKLKSMVGCQGVGVSLGCDILVLSLGVYAILEDLTALSVGSFGQ